jgi:hypothetical protein
MEPITVHWAQKPSLWFVVICQWLSCIIVCICLINRFITILSNNFFGILTLLRLKLQSILIIWTRKIRG